MNMDQKADVTSIISEFFACEFCAKYAPSPAGPRYPRPPRRGPDVGEL